MHHQSLVFGQTDIQLEHMQDTLMFSEDLQSVLWPFPGSSSMTDTKYFIRLDKVIKGFINVFHSLVNDIWKEQKERGNYVISGRDDESQPFELHYQKNLII